MVGGVAGAAADDDVADLPALADAAQRVDRHAELTGGVGLGEECGQKHNAARHGVTLLRATRHHQTGATAQPARRPA